MNQSPFHIYAKARELAGYVDGDNKLVPAFASSEIKIFPYQIAAALFAPRSPYLMGVILADEGSSGKTYEALLIATQRWYEGKNMRPENYGELTDWVSQYCFRTLKNQVTDYVDFPNRIPYTIGYELTAPEKLLYAKLEEYLALPKLAAYPKMDRYDLNLMHYHIVSSSPQALCRTLDGVDKRMFDKMILYEKGAEELLDELQELAAHIEISGKMKTLLSVLKKCFARLGLKAEKKAIIFTDNRVTQQTLSDLLETQGYKGVQTYSGKNSREYSIMERFWSDKNAQILIATDEVAKGLDIEFCPTVINFDLLYNAVELDRRITRCHRQGQQSDVLVVNLLGKDNFSDVRIMELINKCVLQFDGIFGLADNILGNFDADIDEVFEKLRHRDTIKGNFNENLSAHKSENRQLVENTESSIFTSFTKEVADSITLTPEYIDDKIAAINSESWEVVKWFFEDWNDNHPEARYHIDEQSQTITAPDSPQLSELFYYWNGSRNHPYRSLRQYGMAPAFKPHQGRIMLASILGRHILDEVYCESNGTLRVDAVMEPCIIGYYAVHIATKGQTGDKTYYTFLGETPSGKILSGRECREIMALPVIRCEEERVTENIRKNYNSRIFTSATVLNPRQIDTLLPTDEFITKRLNERDSVQANKLA